MRAIKGSLRLSGFTLIELLVVLTIAAIIVFQIAPSFAELIQAARINTAVSQMERSLRFARSTALLRKAPVRLCPSEDGNLCSASGDWSKGWITFVDQYGGSTRDPEDEVVATQASFRSIQLYYNRGSLLSLNALGRVTQSGTMRICDPRQPHNSVALVIIHSARLRREKGMGSCS
ncbi:MAG: GspH/FimT family pseudopilin [Gammaproteobacteria bacterium]